MLGLFRRKPTATEDRKGQWRAFIADGVVFAARKDDLPEDGVGARFLDNPAVGGLLVQLDDDGRLTASKTLSWGDVYDLLEGAERREVRDLFGLPDVAAYVPALASKDSLRDPTFDIIVSDWRAPDGARAPDAEVCGAAVVDGEKVGLLPRATWELLERVGRFRNGQRRACGCRKQEALGPNPTGGDRRGCPSR